jgi:hypothetical protein
MSTPGAPLVWCFGSGNEVNLSVTVDPDSIRVHVKGTDPEVRLKSVNELVEWLQAHQPGSLTDQKSRVIDRLKAGNLFKWE